MYTLYIAPRENFGSPLSPLDGVMEWRDHLEQLKIKLGSTHMDGVCSTDIVFDHHPSTFGPQHSSSESIAHLSHQWVQYFNVSLSEDIWQHEESMRGILWDSSAFYGQRSLDFFFSYIDLLKKFWKMHFLHLKNSCILEKMLEPLFSPIRVAFTECELRINPFLCLRLKNPTALSNMALIFNL